MSIQPGVIVDVVCDMVVSLVVCVANMVVDMYMVTCMVSMVGMTLNMVVDEMNMAVNVVDMVFMVVNAICMVNMIVGVVVDMLPMVTNVMVDMRMVINMIDMVVIFVTSHATHLLGRFVTFQYPSSRPVHVVDMPYIVMAIAVLRQLDDEDLLSLQEEHPQRYAFIHRVLLSSAKVFTRREHVYNTRLWLLDELDPFTN